MPKRHEWHNIFCKFSTLQCVRWGLNTQSLNNLLNIWLERKMGEIINLEGRTRAIQLLDLEKNERQLKISSKLTKGQSTQHPVHFLHEEPLSITLNPRVPMIEISSFPLFCRTEYWLIPQCWSHGLCFRMCDMQEKRLNSKWIHPQPGRGFLFFCPCNSELPNGPEQFRYACLPLWSRRTQGCDVRNGGVEGEFQCLNSLSLEMSSISLIVMGLAHFIWPRNNQREV